jgi:Rps23 Pro-64 3,4-dihydroxylase Tpa1-like proline 4-hydroxylase|tara:strand:+ start:95 stop:697 length:603 start_codon:yes stop_codon:yes gene_type:complete
MNVKDYIKIYDNVARPNLIDGFLEYCKNIEYKTARIQKEIDEDSLKKIRNTDIHDIARLETAPDQIAFDKLASYTQVHWSNILKDLIVNTNQRYAHDLNLPFSPVTQIENTTLLRYRPGGHYVLHVDDCLKFHRVLSFIMFVNDDFEGGELSFGHSDYKEYLTIKPKKNRVVFFPSNFAFPHKVAPIKKGIRYTVVSWLN